ncbi:hypothetical protein pdam_00022244 [Pocillopora damicornis]|uniref:G-protein coupled receptors family 1 profile domain-containing protein n=1 Tax=Pocillopora damicornis TaxID=46731 RepID=A0A3M6UTV5_POCDA|nr:hypothetical protein pdam_00022244 [Pocillopora damicornis]
METVFWVLGCLFCIITMIVNGFVIFLVCSQRELRTKTNTFVVLKRSHVDYFEAILYWRKCFS